MGLLTLLLVSIVVFAATQFLQGDAARVVLGRSAKPERLAELRAQLHLDQPMATQYGTWLMGQLSGDLGVSLVSSHPVGEQVGPRVANSFMFLLIVGIIGILPAIVIGFLAAVQRGCRADTTISVIALAIAGAPKL